MRPLYASPPRSKLHKNKNKNSPHACTRHNKNKHTNPCTFASAIATQLPLLPHPHTRVPRRLRILLRRSRLPLPTPPMRSPAAAITARPRPSHHVRERFMRLRALCRVGPGLLDEHAGSESEEVFSRTPWFCLLAMQPTCTDRHERRMGGHRAVDGERDAPDGGGERDGCV